MKKILFYTAFLITCFIAKVNAQSDQLETNYLFNPVMYNPAYTTVNDFMNANLMTRLQWAGSPMTNKTYTGTIQSTFPNSDKMGAGLQIQADNYSIYHNYTIKLNYAYKLPLSDYMNLHMGLQGVYDNYNANYNELNYALPTESTPVDPSFNITTINKSKMNFGAGLYLINEDRYYLSVSIPRILNNDLNGTSDSSQIRFKRAYYFSGGMILGADGNVPIRPSFMVRYDETYKQNLVYDLNCTFLLSHIIWAGVGVRNFNTLSLIGQMDLTDHVRAAFSYDMPFQTGIGSNSKGTFEIGVSVNTGVFANQTVQQRYF
jgi:type IX secretion system PorP/SprF family membrane protein